MILPTVSNIVLVIVPTQLFSLSVVWPKHTGFSYLSIYHYLQILLSSCYMFGHASSVSTDFHTYSVFTNFYIFLVPTDFIHSIQYFMLYMYIRLIINFVHETMHISLPHLVYQYIQRTDCIPFLLWYHVLYHRFRRSVLGLWVDSSDSQ